MRLLRGPWRRAGSDGGGRASSHAGEAALVIDLDGELHRRLAPLIERRGLTVEAERRGAAALDILLVRRFRLVVCGYPLADMVLKDFLLHLRDPASASRRASALVMAVPELAAAAEQLVGRGANAVLTRTTSDAVVAAALERLTSVAPRAQVSWPATVTLGEGATLRGHVVNVSLTGALLACPGRPNVGSRCRIDVVPEPETAFAAGARVVRHAVPGREQQGDFAVSFEGLEPAAAERVRGALAQ